MHTRHACSGLSRVTRPPRAIPWWIISANKERGRAAVCHDRAYAAIEVTGKRNVHFRSRTSDNDAPPLKNNATRLQCLWPPLSIKSEMRGMGHDNVFSVTVSPICFALRLCARILQSSYYAEGDVRCIDAFVRSNKISVTLKPRNRARDNTLFDYSISSTTRSKRRILNCIIITLQFQFVKRY